MTQDEGQPDAPSEADEERAQELVDTLDALRRDADRLDADMEAEEAESDDDPEILDLVASARGHISQPDMSFDPLPEPQEEPDGAMPPILDEALEFGTCRIVANDTGGAYHITRLVWDQAATPPAYVDDTYMVNVGARDFRNDSTGEAGTVAIPFCQQPSADGSPEVVIATSAAETGELDVCDKWIDVTQAGSVVLRANVGGRQMAVACVYAYGTVANARSIANAYGIGRPVFEGLAGDTAADNRTLYSSTFNEFQIALITAGGQTDLKLVSSNFLGQVQVHVLAVIGAAKTTNDLSI